MNSGRTMSLPIVAATAVPDIAPKALREAATTTACSGVRTLVETTVAIALGASVQPLTNSAASTSPSTTSSIGVNSIRSRVLQHNAFDHVGHVLALVCGLLHEAIELAPLDDD